MLLRSLSFWGERLQIMFLGNGKKSNLMKCRRRKPDRGAGVNHPSRLPVLFWMQCERNFQLLRATRIYLHSQSPSDGKFSFK